MRKYIVAIVTMLFLTACGGAAPQATPEASTPAPATQPAATSGIAVQPTAAASPTNATGASGATPYPAPPLSYPNPSQDNPAPTTGTTTTAPAELVSTARDRLAQYLKITADRLTLQTATAQTWPDTAVGCPAPDQSYSAVQVPGYQLSFSDGSRAYDVHTSLQATPGEPLVLCENKLPVDLAVASTPASPSQGAEAVIELAKQDLAKTTGVDINTITVVSSNPVQWNDSSLGCPKPGQNYMQVVTPGFLVRLSANGQVYEYHTDTNTAVVQCTP